MATSQNDSSRNILNEIDKFNSGVFSPEIIPSPTISDRINEYWIDFVNYWDTLSIWHYFETDRYDYERLKSKTSWLLDSATFKISFDDIMLLMTLFVLFGENIELATLPPYADAPFAAALAVCMFSFTVELILNTWSKSTVIWTLCPFSYQYDGYIFSFFWWFDLLAILSLWPDIPWIADPLNLSILSSGDSGSANSYTNAARVVRLVRLVRFIRLYRLVMERRRAKRQHQYLEELVDTGVIDDNEAERLRILNNERQSKLGIQLSSIIIQYIIFIMLLLLLIIPILMPNQVDDGPDYGIFLLHQVSMDNSLSNVSKQAIINQFLDAFNQGPFSAPESIIISLAIEPLYQSLVLHDGHRIDNLRSGTKLTISYTSFNISTNTTYFTQGIFDDRQFLYKVSQYSIYLTICAAFLLVFAYIVLSNDVKRLVLKPIERMMNMVDVVAQDPLQPLGDIMYDIAHKGQSKRKLSSGQYETQILELSLEKVTGLLRVGFGEAGAGIIRSNLSIQPSDSANSEMINALIPGIRIYALFGFCDIHHFEEINKALGKDVLTFVNTIAEVVHSSVHTWGGQCNKNLGNAFVIVWRIGDEVSLASVLNVTASVIRSTSPPALSPPSNKATERFNDNASDTGTIRSYKTLRPSTTSIYGRESESNRGSGRSILSQNTRITFSNGNGHGTSNSVDDDRSFTKSSNSFILKRSMSHTPSDGGNGKDSRHSESAENLSDMGSASGREKGKGKSRETGSDGSQSEISGKHKDHRKLVTIDLRKIPGVEALADSALISYLKIVAEINRANSLLKYRSEPRLLSFLRRSTKILTTPRPQSQDKQQSIHEQSYDNFRLRMGFGLHAGWAIEGAVGSIYKVDATYLSPHVNMAARLETASRQYGVSILMSHIFHELLSDVFQEKCRQIDKVTVKGSEVPIGIFTYDCLQDQEFMKRPKSDYLLYSGIKKKLDRSSLQTMADTSSTGPEFGVSTTVSPRNFSSGPEPSSSPERRDSPISGPSNSPSSMASPERRDSPEPRNSTDSRIDFESITYQDILHDRSNDNNVNSESNMNNDNKAIVAFSEETRVDTIHLNESKEKTISDMEIINDNNVDGSFSPKESPDSKFKGRQSLRKSISLTLNKPFRTSFMYPDNNNGDGDDNDNGVNSSYSPSSVSPYISKSNSLQRESLRLALPSTILPIKRSVGLGDVEMSPKSQDDSLSVVSKRRSTMLMAKLFKIDENLEPTIIEQQQQQQQQRDRSSLDDCPVGAAIIAPTDLFGDGSSSGDTTPEPIENTPFSLHLFFMTPDDTIEDILACDADIVRLRQHVTPEFMETFKEGFKFYIQGDWVKAKVHFLHSDELMAKAAPSLGGDGPSQTLLKYMESFENKPPKSWRGYRALTNK